MAFVAINKPAIGAQASHPKVTPRSFFKFRAYWAKDIVTLPTFDESPLTFLTR